MRAKNSVIIGELTFKSSHRQDKCFIDQSVKYKELF